MHTVWREPGDWLQAKDEGKHIKAFHRLLQTEPEFLSSRCFPTMDAILEAARALAKVQAEMYLRAQIDNVTEEEKFKGHMQIMDALRRKNGAPLEMDMPDNVATGIAATGFGEVAGGDAAFQTLTDEKNNTSIIILKQRSLMQWIIS
eukprot:6463526-Amphidinium_carterae.1